MSYAKINFWQVGPARGLCRLIEIVMVRTNPMARHGRKMEKARQPSGIEQSTAIVRSGPGNKSRAFVRFGAVTVPAAIGRSGRTISKREGDGATPVASMRLLYGFMRGDRIRLLQTSLPMERTRKEMLW